jgi:prevent-host-death family protein
MKKPGNRVNIYDAKAHLSRLIMQVEDSGKPIVICRNNVPVADLVPHSVVSDPFKLDPKLSGAEYKCDPCAGVDEEDWPGENR